MVCNILLSWLFETPSSQINHTQQHILSYECPALAWIVSCQLFYFCAWGTKWNGKKYYKRPCDFLLAVLPYIQEGGDQTLPLSHVTSSSQLFPAQRHLWSLKHRSKCLAFVVFLWDQGKRKLRAEKWDLHLPVLVPHIFPVFLSFGDHGAALPASPVTT